MNGRTVGQLMRPVRGRLKLEDEVTLRELRRLLSRARHLPVLDREGRFAGFLLRADLLKLLDRGLDERIAIRELVRAARPISKDEALETAARTVTDAGTHVLPVVDGEGRLVGLLTDHALLRALISQRPAAPSAREAPSLSVDDVMTAEPISVPPDASLGEAAGTMLEAGVRHLPVVDSDRRVIGMLSERDLREQFGANPRDWFRAAADVLDEHVEQVMTNDPVTVRGGAALADALESLERERVGALPVVDEEDRLVGMLSYVDALSWMREAMLKQTDAEEAAPNAP